MEVPAAARITALSDGWLTRPSTSARLLDALRAVPAGQLDAVLLTVDVDRMLASLRGWRIGHRQKAVDLLLRERVEELSTQAIAEIVSALHTGPTPRSSQEAVVEVMTTKVDTEFHDLKYRLNSTKDHHDLEHLVFEDLEEDLQERLLEHIADEADYAGSSDLRVLCDIDDTVKCVIHDDRYPRGVVYPGVVTLLHALDKGGADEPDRPGDLTFVTARPGGPRGLVEQYTRNKLGGLGLPQHSVMGGSFLNLHTKNAIAERKLQNMDRDRLLFPECRMVFIGDSGQADGAVGAEMHQRDPRHIVGTLLHNVTDLDAAQRAEWADRGVHVFDTYAGAAAHAVRLGLIRVDQAREVAAAVRSGLELLDLSGEQRERLARDLAADEAAIEQLAS
ncbi:phosphatase domain-containing protein [Ornithinimicrobium flavum]|uniref:phosphatase domain-containing protein n=1 Tax=Ornithinimicrobium flavum TaxID=1288636 RepID=UPI00106FDC67|nr:phosphatase domain-containing protein [Ornithinimicrobium flavum]